MHFEDSSLKEIHNRITLKVSKNEHFFTCKQRNTTTGNLFLPEMQQVHFCKNFPLTKTWKIFKLNIDRKIRP